MSEQEKQENNKVAAKDEDVQPSKQEQQQQQESTGTEEHQEEQQPRTTTSTDNGRTGTRASSRRGQSRQSSMKGQSRGGKRNHRCSPKRNHVFSQSQADKQLTAPSTEEVEYKERGWAYTTSIDQVDGFQQSRLNKLLVPGDTLPGGKKFKNSSGSPTGSNRSPRGGGAERNSCSVVASSTASGLSPRMIQAVSGAAHWLELMDGKASARQQQLQPLDIEQQPKSFYVPAPVNLPKTFELPQDYVLPKLPPVKSTTSPNSSPNKSNANRRSRRQEEQ